MKWGAEKYWRRDYPSLTLEQVHGAMAFYLGDQKEIDAYLVKVAA